MRQLIFCVLSHQSSCSHVTYSWQKLDIMSCTIGQKLVLVLQFLARPLEIIRERVQSGVTENASHDPGEQVESHRYDLGVSPVNIPWIGLPQISPWVPFPTYRVCYRSAPPDDGLRTPSRFPTVLSIYYVPFAGIFALLTQSKTLVILPSIWLGVPLWRVIPGSGW